MSIRFDVATGADVAKYIDQLARLRIEVFREYPYLYDGDLAYEQTYLESYAASPASTLVIAMADGRVVGASTALPLAQHSDDVVPPLVAAGFPPDAVYYFGESVLEPAYRGKGMGETFFVEREARARSLGFPFAAFCAIQRPSGDPRAPADYRPRGALWSRHGFVRRPDIVAQFSWRDVGDSSETIKPMVFWIKALRP
ncbi:MAG TPA: GNAT family N-acetyltransferase [Kofleriaceae bacterium]